MSWAMRTIIDDVKRDVDLWRSAIPFFKRAFNNNEKLLHEVDAPEHQIHKVLMLWATMESNFSAITNDQLRLLLAELAELEQMMRILDEHFDELVAD